MNSLILITISFSMFSWAIYQIIRGEVFGHEGFTRFSKARWHSRKDECVKFWYLITGEILISFYALYLAFSTPSLL